MFNANKFNQIPFNGVPGERPLISSVHLQEMLYLFDSDEKLVAVLPQDSFFSTKHYEKLNGDNTFTFSFPADKAEAAYIIEGALIGFKDLDSAWNIFEIKQITDLHGSSLTRTAYCEHIFYELLTNIVTDKRPSSTALSALTGMLENTRWSAGIVDNLGTSSTTAYYENAVSAVKKVATAWAGELQWRIVVSGGVIAERRVDLVAMRGSDTGKQFVYSKDILEIKREKDFTGVYTAMYGRGKGVENESGTAYGRRLTFADEVWTIAGGDPADKPAAQEWVGDTAALAQWGYPDGLGGKRHRYGIYTNEDQTASDTLLQETWDYLQENIASAVTYTISAIALETLTGYSHEAVRLGDTVRVIDREFVPELVISARVVEIERDLQNPQNTTIVLGSFAPMIIDATINTQSRVKEIENRSYNTNWLDGKISVLQNEIENTAAYVFQSETDGILIMNAATFATATTAMKLGGGIFSLANSKIGDAWNWRSFGTGAGFTGDEIVAGVVRTGLVTIASATNNLIIDDDTIEIYDNTIPTPLRRVCIGQYETGEYGAEIINGQIYSSNIRTGGKTDTTYIALGSDGTLQAKVNGNTILESIAAVDHGNMYFGKNDGTGWFGRLLYYNDLYPGFRVESVGENLVLKGDSSAYLIGDTNAYIISGGTIYLTTGSSSDYVTISGNLDVSGDIYKNANHAIEYTENYGLRTLTSVESGEYLYYDRGIINLLNGEVTIILDPIFLECIEPDTELTPWQIWAECYGENGVYVSEVGADYFKIKERNGGTSNNKVVWKHEAIRKNYAGIRLMEVIR